MKKINKSKFLIIILLLIISIGFAFLTARLDINGLANIKKIKWNIYFDNVQNKTGEEFEVTGPTTNGRNTTSLYFEVELEDPGDSYSFDVDVVNDGTIDAKFDILVDNYDIDYSIFDYTITYKDGSELTAGNYLPKRSRDTITITVTYKYDMDINDLPTDDFPIYISLTLNYSQATTHDNHSTTHYDIVDLSGHANDGTVSGATNNRDGTYTLDGVDDTISCKLANYDFKNSISLVVRFKLDSLTGSTERGVLCNTTNSGACFKLTSSGLPRFIFHDGTDFVGTNTKTALVVDEWNTIVATYDGSKIMIYQNGEKQLLTNDDYEYPATGNIKVSNINFGISGFMTNVNMTVSDVLIFDRALTEEEVASDYANNVSPTDKSNLLVYYDFN